MQNIICRGLTWKIEPKENRHINCNEINKLKEMSTQTKDLKSLSDSDFDAQIEHSIAQQETVPRHSADYVHLMNVTAHLKEEKARRGDVSTEAGETGKKIADNIEDDLVGQNPLSTSGTVKKVTPDPTAKDKEDAKEEHAPRKVQPGDDQPDPATINQPMKGVKAGAAKETPENEQK